MGAEETRMMPHDGPGYRAWRILAIVSMGAVAAVIVMTVAGLCGL